ncbi:hypothetical protein [Marinobacterium litorale]|uniref:hypothetical protein n=1 Tax=Marinobacterium litorale TaxID=404770 RepID=UPI0004889DAC|nr:hypothetical protein [Marinobacterium litorale]
MAGKKDKTQSVHLSEEDRDVLFELKKLTNRSISSLLHDALVAAYLNPTPHELQMIRARVAHANSMRTSSFDSFMADFSDRSDRKDQALYSRSLPVSALHH